MTSQNGTILRRMRIMCQSLFLFIFLLLYFYPGISSLETWSSVCYFFYIDPLLLITSFISTGKIIPVLLYSLIPLVLTLFLGRFFCGWICPFGTISQFFSWLSRKSKLRKKALNKGILKVKYFILIAILGSTLAGMSIGGWFDPFSLLTRSLASISPAGNYLIEQPFKIGEGNYNTLEPVHELVKNEILSEFPRSATQSILIGGLFILIIGLNYFRPRFFCNVLCPLGALYGLVAKFGFFCFKTNAACNSCNLCQRNCTYQGNPGEKYLKSECLNCFNCVADCRRSAVDVKTVLLKREDQAPIGLGRRKMLVALGSGVVLASLAKTQLVARNKNRHRFLRPPGALKEDTFLKKCTSCGQCTQACPTGFIQPAMLENGLERLWTPVVNASVGYCLYQCNKCTQICPNGAIQELELKEKQEFKIGLAVIDKNKCYTHADGFSCTVCRDQCPVPDKAIRFKEVEMINFRGEQVPVNQIYVLSDLCNGCGICEYVCPRHDAPGIKITSENESREMETAGF